ncbi:flagellin [Malaciobacter molluscorum LMG 25693]|uniref:FlaG family protein n=1 Tax=Malaciobacter molluscorum LMG 25693 TaxID=870501 RepID=A0A2G1DIR1_9BACT|nr:flagellin [Malaciobacter molluscorum]AXX93140.1 FlaG family protein [Malaciobacter molluscorum LMG 25693]PHO18399.1 flagellin [Malaciobacter molluscorum LMG 25693]
MELGRVAEIDNAKLNHTEKVKKVSEVDNKEKIVADDKYKNASSPNSGEKKEVILDNVKFGYNRSSKDFFVKIIKGDAEYKYPTEDMMRIKAQLLKEIEKQIQES